MKTFRFLTLAAASATKEKPPPNPEDVPRFQFTDCGFDTLFDSKTTSVEISSPLDPYNSLVYPNYATCEWKFEAPKACGFNIDILHFDIEGTYLYNKIISWICSRL